MALPKIEKGSFLIIRTDGATETIEKKPTLGNLRQAIGADELEFVRVGKADDSDIVMAVDEMGYETETVDHGDGRIELRPLRAKKPFNLEGSRLYHAICWPGTTHQIVGDVALCHDADFA